MQTFCLLIWKFMISFVTCVKLWISLLNSKAEKYMIDKTPQNWHFELTVFSHSTEIHWMQKVTEWNNLTPINNYRQIQSPQLLVFRRPAGMLSCNGRHTRMSSKQHWHTAWSSWRALRDHGEQISCFPWSHSAHHQHQFQLQPAKQVSLIECLIYSKKRFLAYQPHLLKTMDAMPSATHLQNQESISHQISTSHERGEAFPTCASKSVRLVVLKALVLLTKGFCTISVPAKIT